MQKDISVHKYFEWKGKMLLIVLECLRKPWNLGFYDDSPSWHMSKAITRTAISSFPHSTLRRSSCEIIRSFHWPTLTWSWRLLLGKVRIRLRYVVDSCLYAQTSKFDSEWSRNACSLLSYIAHCHWHQKRRNFSKNN